jgi:hypothetical protein
MHHRTHHGKGPPVTGDGKRRGCFLVLLSAAIIFLFIVLPFWLLYKRSVKPPAPEAFGPPPASAVPVAEPEPEREPGGPFAPKPPDPDGEDKPVRFK